MLQYVCMCIVGHVHIYACRSVGTHMRHPDRHVLHHRAGLAQQRLRLARHGHCTTPTPHTATIQCPKHCACAQLSTQGPFPLSVSNPGWSPGVFAHRDGHDKHHPSGSGSIAGELSSISACLVSHSFLDCWCCCPNRGVSKSMCIDGASPCQWLSLDDALR